MASMTFSGNIKGTPRWAGDFFSRDHLLPWPGRVDPAQFNDANATKVILSAGAAAAATSLAVTALLGAIPKNTLLFFGEAGEYARTTADAAIGATAIAVEALPAALESGDIAYYSSPAERRTLASGTLVGRTFAERDSGDALGAADDTDDEFFIVVFDCPNIMTNPDVELYRPGSVVKEDYLPDWTAIAADAALLAKLRLRYQCIKGKD